MPSGPPLPSPGSPTLTRGAMIGRYIVLGLVGRGGMGEVYAGYDPELSRKVAVKLLRVKPGGGIPLAEGRLRIFREAQALARLTDPNIVAVYDVGTFEDQVFIAMEFLDGNTVGYWLQAEPRKWQQVLEVFIAAARGLAAAHKKGLVHRDFKPDNVMIGRDGQVRVMDFGLARQAGEKAKAGERSTPPSTTPSGTTPSGAAPSGTTPSGTTPSRTTPSKTPEVAVEAGVNHSETIVLNPGSGAQGGLQMPTSNSELLEARLTRTGAMMGTPAYMAPEQFFGSTTDARTDQFSFCVSLYEALYGERPFSGGNITALTGNVVQGNVRAPPAGSKVPPWLRKVLLRGLLSSMEDRYASMADLLDALAKSPYAARRNAAVAASAVVLVIGFALGVRHTLADDRALCAGAEDKLADTWELAQPGQPEPPRQAQIHAAFLRSDKSYAADVYATASQALTKYARAWAAMYRETCEATQIRHQQPPEVLDLRMSCLNERLGGLRALTNVFEDANGDVVENAVNATNALATLDRCADVPLLSAVIRPPEDPATRARVADLRRRLAALKARFDAGQWKASLENVPALVAEVREVRYQPLVAETLSLSGLMYENAGDIPAAEKAMVEAFLEADSSRHDEVRAEAATNLVFLVGYQEGQFEEARRWALAAQTVLQRLGGHDLLHAWLLNDVGCMYEKHGDWQAAIQSLENGLALKEGVLGPGHPDVGLSEANLANVLHESGQSQKALAHIDRSIALLENGLGAAHPSLATNESNRGEILNALGRYQDARRSFERALDVEERQLARDHPFLGYPLTGIGLSYLAEGNPTNAIAPLERALKIRRALKDEPSRLADTSLALARALWESGRAHSRARELAEEAKADYPALSKGRAFADDWLRQHP